MIYHDVIQGSPEWLQLRIGKVTASRVKDIVGTKAKRESYMRELAAEILTGQTKDNYVSSAMQWGIDNEPAARNAYEEKYGFVRNGGFFSDGMMGCSPDFIIPDRKIGGEIKCPNTDTFLRWSEIIDLPEEHTEQVLFSMALTGYAAWDFIAYDPRLIDESAQMMVIRVRRDDYKLKIDELMDAVNKFVDDLNKYVRDFINRVANS